MQGSKLRSGVYWQGALKHKGVENKWSKKKRATCLYVSHLYIYIYIYIYICQSHMVARYYFQQRSMESNRTRRYKFRKKKKKFRWIGHTLRKED